MEEEELTDNQLNIKFFELADELGFFADTIRWVYFGVISAGEDCGASEGDEGQPHHVKAKELCVILLRDLVQIYETPLEESLEAIKIRSSKDFGKIVHGLVGKGLLVLAPQDRTTDFDGLFELENLDDFLRGEGIKRRKICGHKMHKQLMWGMYLAGTAVVILSYMNIVSHKVGWVGWCIGMCGFLVQFIRLPAVKRF